MENGWNGYGLGRSGWWSIMNEYKKGKRSECGPDSTCEILLIVYSQIKKLGYNKFSAIYKGNKYG